jgi:hypothetical protein
LPARGWQVTLAAMKPEIDPKLLNDPVFQRVLADSLAIQDRFSAEPVYAKTGKGSLKSEGVKPLQEIKEARRPKPE